MLKWINSFLCGRDQCVCVNNCFLSFFHGNSGVPQGSILGPLLFVAIKVSKLYDSCGGMYLYADDAKLFSNNVNDLQSVAYARRGVSGVKTPPLKILKEMKTSLFGTKPPFFRGVFSRDSRCSAHTL